jgi:hypothetical protein
MTITAKTIDGTVAYGEVKLLPSTTETK